MREVILLRSLSIREVALRLINAAVRLVEGIQGGMTLDHDLQRFAYIGLRLPPTMEPHEARGWAAEAVFGLTREVTQSAQALIIQNTHDEPRFTSEVWRSRYVQPTTQQSSLGWNKVYAEISWPSPRTLLVVPLMDQGQALGALSIERKQNKPFRLEDQESLLAFTKLCSIALQKARAHESIQSTELQFLSMLRAEMINPLTATRGYLELLKDGAVGSLTEAQQGLITTAWDYSKRSKRIFESISELAHIETERIWFKIETVQLSEIIDQIVKSFQHLLTGKEQTLMIETAPDVFVQADSRHLQNVLRSILENAHQYTQRGGKIAVRTQIHDDYVRVEVSDTGIGIPPECQKRLFTDFFIHSEQPLVSEQRGMGISLYIAAYLVRRMEGEIGCESELEKGSTFWFTLPLAKSARES